MIPKGKLARSSWPDRFAGPSGVKLRTLLVGVFQPAAQPKSGANCCCIGAAPAHFPALDANNRGGVCLTSGQSISLSLI